MGNEYLTIAEIEKITGIPNSNIRRYIASFDSFFIAKGGSRIKKYEAAAVEILKRIKSLYDSGMDTQEIHNVLVKEFPLVVNGDVQGTKGQAPTAPSLANYEEVAKISEDVAEIKKAWGEQKQFNQALILELQQQRLFFEKKFDEIIENQKVTSLRESMKQRKIEVVQEEPVMTSDEEKDADDEPVAIGEQLVNGDEKVTAMASEEVVKARKEAAVAKDEVVTADKEKSPHSNTVPAKESKPKREGWLRRWLHGGKS